MPTGSQGLTGIAVVKTLLEDGLKVVAGEF
jgi:hypothetical protein